MAERRDEEDERRDGEKRIAGEGENRGDLKIEAVDWGEGKKL